MTVSLKTSTRNSKLDAVTSAIGTSGLLQIFDATGGVPANANTSLGSQVKLAELPASSTFAPGSSSGVLTANAFTTSNALATGTAAFYRLCTSAGLCIAQGTVGTSGTDLVMNTTSFVSGGPVAISSFTYTEGNP